MRPAAIAVLVAAAGCYAFVPAEPSGTPPRGAVQIALTNEGSIALTPQIGPSVATLEGRLLADSGSTYVLGVARTVRRDGAETDWRGEKVSIPRPLVSSVETRQLSRIRTVAIGALATGLLALISESFGVGSGGSVSGATGGGAHTGK